MDVQNKFYIDLMAKDLKDIQSCGVNNAHATLTIITE